MLLPTLLALPQPFLRDEAADAGVSRHQLDRQVRRGVLTRVHRGLYAVTDVWAPLEPWRRYPGVVECARRCRPDAVVSHVSAVQVHGLPLPGRPPSRAVLTVEDASTTFRHPWVDLRRGAMPEGDVVDDVGSRVTTVPRTVVDCFRSLPLPDAVAIADAALRRGDCTADQLVAARRRQRRWPGVAAADTGFRLVDPRRETWLESTSAVRLVSWGLPLGIPQVDVLTGAGNWLARVDVAWPEVGVIGEADGRGKWLGDDALGLDGDPEQVRRRLLGSHERAEAIRSLGLGVVRWSPEESRTRPLAVVGRWHEAVAEVARRGHRGVLRCTCCHLPATDCSFDRFPAPLNGVSTGRASNKSGVR